VPHDVRDAILDFIRAWSEKSEIPAARFLAWIHLAASKFHDWKRRYGRVNLHNSWIPRDFWLEDWEREAIVRFYLEHTTDGYRRAAFMMLDANVVAVSPATVYRVLKQAGAFEQWSRTATGKGKGFHQPEEPHEHWHADVSYINIAGTFYYLLSILDGYSRYIVHWEIRESMTEADVEIILQRAREKFPGVSPKIITDNGPQFVARDFKEYIRVSGMCHVKTRPFYPQSNGKIERWHQSLKSECIRPMTPLSLEDAKRLVSQFVDYYNHVRLHSAIGFIAPADRLNGREGAIFTERDRRLAEAREKRRLNRRSMKAAAWQSA
jgi:putative transposase